MKRARLAAVELSDFGVATREPVLWAGLYQQRLARVRERMDRHSYDRVIVYADREHSANISFLTGFDPRFEEALLVVSRDDVAILVGNENWGTAGAATVGMRRHLFQDFSLPSQPRDKSFSLVEILASEGVAPGSRIGLIGWKAYSEPWMSDAPAYVVDTLRDLARPENVVNATPLLNDAQDGLRVVNEPEQIAYLEWAACHVSEGVKRLIRELRPGMTEHEAVSLLRWNGTPLSCH